MKPDRLHRWSMIHRWTSLACLPFLFVICTTGLPLVFRDEIAHWLDEAPPYAAHAAGAARADLDHLVARSRQRYPGEIVTFVFVDDDEPRVLVGMAPSWQAANEQPDSRHTLQFDAWSGQLMKTIGPAAQRRTTFMELMLALHTDLFAGLPGSLFLAAMGACFMLAIVSGVVLYGSFMRKLRFGAVRTGRNARLAWLDVHDLLGIVTLAWALIVGATGIVNELSAPLFGVWQRTDVQAMLTPWQGQPVPAPTELGSVQTAFDLVQQALPGMRVTSVTFPGSRFGSPHHFLVWAKGETPLTSRLFSPTLVDARTDAITATLRMPWYLRALEVSRPLHFGDYGGMPMKVLWVGLDLMVLIVLGSGLYLWLARRRQQRRRAGHLSASRAGSA